jgi:hypothetical protein
MKKIRTKLLDFFLENTANGLIPFIKMHPYYNNKEFIERLILRSLHLNNYSLVEKLQIKLK